MQKKRGGTRFLLKQMPDGGIVYDSENFQFYYLDEKKTRSFLELVPKCRVLSPTVPNPFWLCFFDLSYKCNLKCVHCHNNYGKVKELSLEQKLGVLNQIIELGILHVSFGGGELTLCPELLKILKRASERTTCSFVTNGTLVTEDVCRKLRGLFSYVGVSLDGFKEMHAKMRRADIFDKAVNAIKLFEKHEIPVRVTSCPTKLNYRELPELGEFVLNELNATAWKLMRFIPEGNNGKELALSEEEEKWLYDKVSVLGGDNIDYYFRIKCPAGKSVFSIYANGDVSPCGFLPGLISGNVLEQPLLEILREGKFFKVLRVVESNKCISTSFWRGSNEFNFNVSV